MLVQAHRAQRVDWQTHLLAETDQQPVDLTPQLPGQGGKKQVTYCGTCTHPMFRSFWSRNIVETQADVFFSNTYLDRLQIKSTAVLCCSGVSPSSRPGQPLLQGFARFLRVLGGFSEPAQATGDAVHMRVNSCGKKGQKYVCGMKEDKVHTLQASLAKSIC